MGLARFLELLDELIGELEDIELKTADREPFDFDEVNHILAEIKNEMRCLEGK